MNQSDIIFQNNTNSQQQTIDQQQNTLIQNQEALNQTQTSQISSIQSTNQSQDALITSINASITQINTENTNQTNSINTLTSSLNTANNNITSLSNSKLDVSVFTAQVSTQNTVDQTQNTNISNNTTAINNEITNRTNADTTLQNNINLKANQTDLSTEITNRTNADLLKLNITDFNTTMANYRTSANEDAINATKLNSSDLLASINALGSNSINLSKIQFFTSNPTLNNQVPVFNGTQFNYQLISQITGNTDQIIEMADFDNATKIDQGIMYYNNSDTKFKANKNVKSMINDQNIQEFPIKTTSDNNRFVITQASNKIDTYLNNLLMHTYQYSSTNANPNLIISNNNNAIIQIGTKKFLFDLSNAATNYDTSKTKYLGIRTYSASNTTYTLDLIDINANSDDVNNLVAKINSTAQLLRLSQFSSPNSGEILDLNDCTLNYCQLLEMRVKNSNTATAVIRFRQKTNLSTNYIEFQADDTTQGTQNSTFNWSLIRPTQYQIPCFKVINTANCRIQYDNIANIINLDSIKINIDKINGNATTIQYLTSTNGTNAWQTLPSFSTTLAALTDVNFTVAPTNLQVLQYQTSDNKWHPYTVPGVSFQNLNFNFWDGTNYPKTLLYQDTTGNKQFSMTFYEGVSTPFNFLNFYRLTGSSYMQIQNVDEFRLTALNTMGFFSNYYMKKVSTSTNQTWFSNGLGAQQLFINTSQYDSQATKTSGIYLEQDNIQQSFLETVQYSAAPNQINNNFYLKLYGSGYFLLQTCSIHTDPTAQNSVYFYINSPNNSTYSYFIFNEKISAQKGIFTTSIGKPYDYVGSSTLVLNHDFCLLNGNNYVTRKDTGFQGFYMQTAAGVNKAFIQLNSADNILFFQNSLNYHLFQSNSALNVRFRSLQTDGNNYIDFVNVNDSRQGYVGLGAATQNFYVVADLGHLYLTSNLGSVLINSYTEMLLSTNNANNIAIYPSGSTYIRSSLGVQSTSICYFYSPNWGFNVAIKNSNASIVNTQYGNGIYNVFSTQAQHFAFVSTVDFLFQPETHNVGTFFIGQNSSTLAFNRVEVHSSFFVWGGAIIQVQSSNTVKENIKIKKIGQKQDKQSYMDRFKQVKIITYNYINDNDKKNLVQSFEYENISQLFQFGHTRQNTHKRIVKKQRNIKDENGKDTDKMEEYEEEESYNTCDREFFDKNNKLCKDDLKEDDDKQKYVNPMEIMTYQTLVIQEIIDQIDEIKQKVDNMIQQQIDDKQQYNDIDNKMIQQEQHYNEQLQKYQNIYMSSIIKKDSEIQDMKQTIEQQNNEISLLKQTLINYEAKMKDVSKQQLKILAFMSAFQQFDMQSPTKI